MAKRIASFTIFLKSCSVALILFFLILINASASVVFTTEDAMLNNMVHLGVILLVFERIVAEITLRKRKKSIYVNLILIAAVTIQIMWTSIIHNEIGAYGLNKITLGYSVPLILILIISRITWNDEDIYNAIYYFTYFTIAVALIYKIASGGMWDRQIRFGLFGPITYGWMIGAYLVLKVAYNKKTGLRSHWIEYGVLGCNLIWCGSKGPILAVILSIIILNRDRFVKNILAISLGVVLVYVSILMQPESNLRVLQGFEKLIDLILSDKIILADADQDGSIMIRLLFWTETIRLIMSELFLGIGVGNWGIYFPYETDEMYPHNIILEILVENGLFVSIAIFVIAIILHLMNNKKTYLMYYVIFFILALQTSGDISYIRYPLIIWLMILYSKPYIVKTTVDHPHVNKMPKRYQVLK